MSDNANKMGSDIFLLTPLREGRQLCGVLRNWFETISTHAPAGGATSSVKRDFARYSLISTHAPAGGATENSSRSKRALYDFYSRPCGRGDI